VHSPGRDEIAAIGHRVLSGKPIDRSEAEQLAATENTHLDDLFYWANRIRSERQGPHAHLCSIIAARFGGCPEDCKFCAQSARWLPQAERRRISPEQIVAAAIEAETWGSECFGIVTSGRGVPGGQLSEIEDAIRRISARGGITPCASLGLLTAESAGRLARAGLRRYNHNLETGRRFFPAIVSTHTYDERVQTLVVARQAGLELCAGGIFGVGEAWGDRLDLAFELVPFAPRVVPLNFLHPIPGTPLADHPPLRPMEILKIVAVFRFVFPDAILKVAGGREKNLRDLQSWIFRTGANGILVGNYLATCGRGASADLQMLADAEMPVADVKTASCAAAVRPMHRTGRGTPSAT